MHNYTILLYAKYKGCCIPIIYHVVKIISFGDLYVDGALLNLYLIALSLPAQEEAIAFARAASFIPIFGPFVREA